MEDEGISLPEISFDEDNSRGGGHFSATDFITIQGKDKVLNVVVKKAIGDEVFREASSAAQMYRNEITLYDRIFPVFRQFQEEKALKEPFDGVPKCFATCSDPPQEALVLEDLKSSGFVEWNKSEEMDDEHVTLVLKEYARFHALGFAFKDQRGDEFREMTRNLIDIYEAFMSNPSSRNTFQDGVVKAKEALRAGEDDVFIDRYEKFLGSITQRQEARFVRNADEYTTIIHGDCWCNNMMFKYEVRVHDIRLINLACSSGKFPLEFYFHASFIKCTCTRV